jgi:YggT family protein
MDVIVLPLLKIALIVLDIYRWALIAYVILSWLLILNVMNARNQFVYMVGDFLRRILEPVLVPIRRILPNMGGIDLSVLVLFLAIYFVQMVLSQLMVRLFV